MKASIILADTGRPTAVGATSNLLNAGWNVTMAMPLRDGGWTLPDQVVAVFIDAEWNELNKPVVARIVLTDDDNLPVRFANTGGETSVAEVQQTITVPSVGGAPNGTPGVYSMMLDVQTGMLRLTRPRARLTWTLWIDGAVVESRSFWVNQPPSMPEVGGVTNV